jgi:hypothetical protein
VRASYKPFEPRRQQLGQPVELLIVEFCDECLATVIG